MAPMPSSVAPTAARPATGSATAVERPPVMGFAIVLVAASLFGTLGPLSRFAYDAGMTPLAFVAWRGAIGLIATSAFVAWRIRRGSERMTFSAALAGFFRSCGAKNFASHSAA